MKPCLCCIDRLSQEGEYEMCQNHHDEAMRNYQSQYPKQYKEMIQRIKFLK